MADTPKWVFGAPVSPAARLLVSLLWTYAKHGENDPFVFPSRAKLAELTGQTKRGIIKQLASLKVAGMLSTSIRGKKWGFVLRSSRSERLDTVGTTVQVNDGSDGEQPGTDCTAVPSGVNSGVQEGERPFRLEGTAVHTEAVLKPQLESPIEATPQPPPGETLSLVPPEPKRDIPAELLAYENEIRKSAIPGARTMRMDPTRRKLMAAILKTYSVEDCRHAIEAVGLDAKANKTTASYWAGVYVWRPRNFAGWVDTQPGVARSAGRGGRPSKHDGIRSGSFRAEDANHKPGGETWIS